MKQLMRERVASRRRAHRRRDRTANPAVLAELALIADLRRTQPDRAAAPPDPT